MSNEINFWLGLNLESGNWRAAFIPLQRKFIERFGNNPNCWIANGQAA
jgi:hypothetical protein